MKTKITTQSEHWPITANRYVGFIDIMGFKDLVARSTHDEIYILMLKIEDAKNLNETVKWGNIQERLVKSTMYSDSIILYSKDDSEDSVRAICHTLSALTNDLIVEGIPHKGALAFGEMTLDQERSIFFGQPLIDGFLLQEELAMYGIIIHSSAQKQIEIQKPKYELFLFNYCCPLKVGSTFHLTIPPLYAGEIFSEEDRIEHNKLNDSIKRFRHQTSGHLRKYIDNTEQYLKKHYEEDVRLNRTS